MKLLSVSLLQIALCLAAPAVTAQTTQKLSATKANDYGLVYTLPKTAVDVTLEAQCVVQKPGEFANYATKYFKTTPVIRESSQWTLLSATLWRHAVADADQRYNVTFKSGSPVSMVINEENAPLAVNDDNFTGTLTAVTLPAAKEAQPTILDTPAARQAMTQEMLQSTSTAKRAELAAARIYELRQMRTDISSGNVDNMPPDGQAMKLALDNLNSQEEALTAMFFGTTQVSTQVRTYTFMPGDDSGRVLIARLSQLDGLVDADDLSGAPIYLDYTVEQKGEIPLTDRGEEKKMPKGALAYRIPGSATLAVTYDGKTLARERFNIAQLGVVFGLDPAIFSDRKAPAYVHFDPLTGAVSETGAKQ